MISKTRIKRLERGFNDWLERTVLRIIPDMTDGELQFVIDIHDKYLPGELMTPEDSKAYLSMVKSVLLRLKNEHKVTA